MEINKEKICFADDVTFSLRTSNVPILAQQRHFHQEFELTYIEAGFGKLYTGNSIVEFSKGSLFLIAPNLTHSFKNSRNLLQNNLSTKIVSVYFRSDFLGKDLLNRLELIKLKEFLWRASHGIFHFETGMEVRNLIKQIDMASSLSGIVILMEILNKLSLSKEIAFYSQNLVINKYYLKHSSDNRIERIKEFLMAHYHENISCCDIANMVHMSVASFSRFFKHRTRKTFTEVLIELRLMQAQKLLIGTIKPVHEIGKECGFNNLSNFNRKFKQIYKMSPGEFREYNW